MAIERETTRADEPTHTTVIEREGGGSGAGWVIALAAIAVLAIAAFFLLNASQNDAIETAAVSGAASSVAGSVDQAADSVSGAAGAVADGASVPAPEMPAAE